MNDAAKKWVAALRSGKYRQGAGVLREGDQFCCLGVACDLSRIGKWKSKGGSTWYEVSDPDFSDDTLPHAVADFYGMQDTIGSFNPDDLPDEMVNTIREKVKVSDHGRQFTLTNLNDYGFDFQFIADLIEAEPKGLFESEEYDG